MFKKNLSNQINVYTQKRNVEYMYKLLLDSEFRQ